MYFHKFFLNFLLFFLVMTNVVYSADECGVDATHQATFTSAADTYARVAPTLTTGSHEKYYFNITTAGTLTITTASAGDKIKVAYSDTTCPTAVSADPIARTVTVTGPTDINVDLVATSDRTYTITATFVPSPLAVSKSNAPLQMAVNTPTGVLYTLKVRNYSAANLSNVRVTDTLPSGVTMANVSAISAPTGWNCSASTAPSLIDCTLASLPANTTHEINVTSTASSATVQNLVNTAHATATGGWSAAGSSTLAAVSGTGTVDLEIQKFASSSIIAPNTDFAYLIFVINYDNTPAQLVKVTDTLPPLSEGNITIQSAGGNGWTCTVPANVNSPVDANRTIVCDYNQPLGKGITYFLINAHTGGNDFNNTSATNNAGVSTLNPDTNNPNHPNSAHATTLISTESTGGGVVYTGYYPVGGSVEVSDATITNRSNAYILTKVAATQATTFPVYYVNPTTGAVTDYNGTNQSVPLTVVFKLTDETCSAENQTYLGYNSTDAVVASFDVGAGPVVYAHTPPNTTYNFRSIAKRKGRLLMKYLDINSKLSFAGESCANSNLSANIKGLPQCIANSTNSELDNNKYINTFGIDAFMRCAINNGQPCLASHGGVGEPPYDNEYGCYECTVGGAGYCSKDTFAIRPDHFEFSLTPTTPAISPNLLRAGQEYTITIHAPDVMGNLTPDYNQTSSNIVISAPKKWMPNGTLNNDLNGTASFPTSFSFSNGSSNNATMTFSDVGKITVDLNDTNWAQVDENDTGTTLAQRRIYGEGNYTYIPYRFMVSGPRLVDSRDGNFTYYSNDLNMSAKFDFNATSQNKQGGTTLNFDTASWEHPISVLPSVFDNLRGDANESNITASAVGFASGIKHLAWNDGNTSRVLKFNFSRDPSVPLDPTEVNATEANLSVSSTYTDTYLGTTYTAVPENNATNKVGSNNGMTGNAIFLYGRADAPDFRFPNHDPDSLVTHGCGRVYFEFYNTVPNNPLVQSVFGGVMPPLSFTSDRFWYQNTLHETATDGNISGIATPPIAVYGFNVNHNATCIGPLFGPGFEKRVFEYDAQLSHGGFGFPFKSTAILDLTDWLDVTGNNFGVEFYKPGKWIGEDSQGQNKTATDPNADTVTNRRINW